MELYWKKTDENGKVTNAAQNMLKKVDNNPYEQFDFAFNNFLPGNGTPLKEEIAKDPAKIAIVTVAYAKLAKAGKINQT